MRIGLIFSVSLLNLGDNFQCLCISSMIFNNYFQQFSNFKSKIFLCVFHIQNNLIKEFQLILHKIQQNLITHLQKKIVLHLFGDYC